MNINQPNIRAWQRLQRMITLLDVQEYLASRLVKINEHFTACHLIGTDIHGKDTPTQQQAHDLRGNLGIITDECKELSLPLTALLASRIAALIAGTSGEKFHKTIGELNTRFDDELGEKKLFLVPPDVFGFYNNSTIAGESFKAAFPKANSELIEAGNCLVLDRHTACVFHSMRAVEFGLKALEKHLDISAPAKGQENTWGKILGRIKAKMEENDKTKAAHWAVDERDFADKCHTLIAAIKTSDRDPTMHVESTYDPASAMSVFHVVVEALKFIATRLRE